MAQTHQVHVFVISDATGVTAEAVISAALVQFQQLTPMYHRFSHIQNWQQLAPILEKARGLDAIVIYTLVSPDLREQVQRETRLRQIPSIDLLGPLLSMLSNRWHVQPDCQPGRLRSHTNDSVRLAEAIDFTIKHDDGLGLETIANADLLLLGISRTSKTPTSLYLSCNYGLKVANYPILAYEDLPEVLYDLTIPKVGFVISPKKLATIRKIRMKHLTDTAYANIRTIMDELRFCKTIFRKLKDVYVIDVTEESIEEIANIIMDQYNNFRGMMG